MKSVALSLCVLLCAGLAFGQAASGTITGIVADPTGAVIANAAIEVRNTENGQLYRVASTDTGNYTVTQLPVGRYQVDVNVAGFKKFSRQNVTLSAAQVMRLDIPLEVGANTETVTVTAESTLLKTETGDLVHNITLDQLQSLPLLGTGNANSGSSGIRNPYNAVNTVPGVVYSANSTMIVNGAPNNSAAYRLEGLDNTNHTVAFAVQENQPSPDAVQEIAVQTSNYAAEFGAAGGGLINVVMKSGTNQYHGGLFEYFVNEDLNAARPFSITADGNKYRDRNRRNDFGGTFGGPIWIPKVYDGRNKSFFFFSYEQFKESSILNPGQTLPTAAYRTGDFSAISVNGGAGFNPNLGVVTTALPSKDSLGRNIFANTIYDPKTRVPGGTIADPFPNNVIPTARLDPTALKIQTLIPLAQNANFTNNASYTDLSDRYTPLPSLKLDQSVGSKGKLSFYWSTTRTTSQYSLPNGNADGLGGVAPTITQARGTFIYSLTERLNYDHTLTPTTLLHLGAGYSRISFYDGGPVQNFDCATISLINCQASIYFPRLITGTTTGIGGMQSLGNAQAHTLTVTQRPSFNANLTSIHGSHTFKVGGEVWFQGNNTNPPSGITLTYGVNATSLPQGGLSLGTSRIGFEYASFLLGDVSSAAQNAPRGVRMGQSQWGFFAQDTWKVNRKLTLDLGLRWDYGSAARETYGRSATFSPTGINTNAGGHPGTFIYEQTCGCQFVSNYMYGIGPRIGLAYQINPKTVLRAGWGFAYAPVGDIGISTPNSATNSPAGTNAFFNIQDPTTVPKPLWPNFDPSIYPLIVNGVGTTNNNLAALDRNIARPPRQNQWSIGLQREISRNFVVEATYVASRGVWWGNGPLGLLNQVSPANYASHGLDPYHNAGDNTLINSAINSPAVIARFGDLTPYAGFPSTGTVLNALRPFPQFNNIAVTSSPTGKTFYDSLQAKVTQRLSHGLSVTGSFTWSKSLDFIRQEFFNPTGSDKRLQSTDVPLALNLNINYTTQRSEMLNKFKFVNALWKDWLVTWSSTYQSGALLTPPNQTTTNFLALGNTSPMIRVPGVPLFLKDLNCHCLNPYTDQFLNPAAWTNVTTGGPSSPDYTTNNTGGSANGFYGPQTFYSDFRAQRHPIESFNLGRNFRIKERMNFQIRAEFTNILNRTFIAGTGLGIGLSTTAPRSPVSRNAANQITGGFGTVNATAPVGGFPGLVGNASLPRQGTLIGRFTF